MTKLGQLANEGDPDRDAVHVAVLRGTARVRVDPGQVVFFDEEGHMVWGDEQPAGSGIVDPFLQKIVEIGEKFWILLSPGVAKNLHHSFDIDSIKEETEEEHRDWCRQHCGHDDDDMPPPPDDMPEPVGDECRGCES